jgi:hypothetical protein
MASYDYLETRNLNRIGITGNKADDKPVALRIRNINGKTVTSVVIIAATSIVLIDSDGTTTCAFNTYNTIGKVADYINATANWRCKILDALRSDTSTSKVMAATMSPSSNTTMKDGIEYYDMCVDTDGLDAISYRLTPSRGVLINAPKISRRVHLNEIKYYVNCSADQADGVRVYEIQDGTETQIYTAPIANSAATTVNFGSAQGYITSAENAELLVRITATAFTDGAGNYLRVTGSVE